MRPPERPAEAASTEESSGGGRPEEQVYMLVVGLPIGTCKLCYPKGSTANHVV